MTTCYNPSKKFMFIHIHKCAGSAITKALTKYDFHEEYEDDEYYEEKDRPGWELVRNTAPKTIDIMNENNLLIDSQFSTPEHFRAIDMQKFLGKDVFSSYFKFAVSRNPWDRVASWYYFLRKKQNKSQSKLARQLTMEDFIKYSVEYFFLPQYQWVTDYDGEIIVDEVIKLDDLSESWTSIVEKISDEPIRLRHVNQSQNTKEPRSNPFANVRTQTLEMFRDAYAKDFDLFGYDKTLPEHREDKYIYKKCKTIWQAEIAGNHDITGLCKKHGVSESFYSLYREIESNSFYNAHKEKHSSVKSNGSQSFDEYKNKIIKLKDALERSNETNNVLREKFKSDFARMQKSIEKLSARNEEISKLYRAVISKDLSS